MGVIHFKAFIDTALPLRKLRGNIMQIQYSKYLFNCKFNRVCGITHVVDHHVEENFIVDKLVLELLNFHGQTLNYTFTFGFCDVVIILRFGCESRERWSVSFWITCIDSY